jgi:hypothetical protein
MPATSIGCHWTRAKTMPRWRSICYHIRLKASIHLPLNADHPRTTNRVDHQEPDMPPGEPAPLVNLVTARRAASKANTFSSRLQQRMDHHRRTHPSNRAAAVQGHHHAGTGSCRGPTYPCPGDDGLLELASQWGTGPADMTYPHVT